jgi:light-regulated signal transduction histidine kinase (bacteriophytochrome)
MESLDQTTIIDLSACEKEQIHLIDSVQPHGALLVLSEPELKVLQVSPNAISLLNCAHKDLVGQRAEVLFSEESVLLIKKILNTHASDDFWPVVPCSISVLQSRIHLQGLLHRYQGVCILELEPMSDPNTEELIAFRHWISTDFAQLFAANTMQKLLERCATEIQKMTGFDRVLIYQFDQDWHGSVVAENKQDFMQSYIGHKFPASDIPPQARELYTKNLIRVLASVDAVQSPITPQINPLTGNRLDLTYSVLRSMSPVHIEYLKNMGVSASMSISLMAKDKLWGLIVCHNKTVKTLDFVKRSTCELIGRLLSGLIEQIEKHEITKGQLRLGLEVEKIIFKLSRSEDLFGSLRQQLSDIIIVPNADGIALISDGTIESCGTTPDEQAIKTLTSWLEEVVQESFFCSEKLSLEHPQWSQIAITASGLIAINISSTSPRWILWFRKEQIKKISWAGNPQKPVEIESKLAPIHPRKSFEIWSESVSGHSLPWKSFEREAAGLLQKHIFGLSLAEIVRTGKTNKILRQQREDMIAILTHDLSVPAIALERVLDSLVSDKTGKIQRELQDIFRVRSRQLRN